MELITQSESWQTVGVTGLPQNLQRSSTSTAPPRNSPHKPLGPVSGKMDIYSLSDVQLIAQLKKYHVPYGPVTGTTRSIYLRKLEKVINEAGEPLIAEPEPEPYDQLDGTSTEEEEEEEEPAPVITQTRTTQKTVRQRIIQEPPKPAGSPMKQFTEPQKPATPKKVDTFKKVDTPKKAEREEPSRYTRPSQVTSTPSKPSSRTAPLTADDLVTQVQPTPEEKPKKGGLSIWIQLLVLLIVAFVIFLVFQNMEPARKTPSKIADSNV